MIHEEILQIMSMGRRKDERQDEFWIATGSLPETPRHVFYEKLKSHRTPLVREHLSE